MRQFYNSAKTNFSIVVVKMATVSVVFRTCGAILLFIILCLHSTVARHTSLVPKIRSFSVSCPDSYKSSRNVDLIQCMLQFRGIGFFGDMRWKITSKLDLYGAPCKEFLETTSVVEVKSTSDKYVAKITSPSIGRNVYFCLYSNGMWMHQGGEITFIPSKMDNTVNLHFRNSRNSDVKNPDFSPGKDNLDISADNINSSPKNDKSINMNQHNVFNDKYLNENFNKTQSEENDLIIDVNPEVGNYDKINININYNENVPENFPSIIHNFDKFYRYNLNEAPGELNKESLKDDNDVNIVENTLEANSVADPQIINVENGDVLKYVQKDNDELIDTTDILIDMSRDIDVNYDEYLRKEPEELVESNIADVESNNVDESDLENDVNSIDQLDDDSLLNNRIKREIDTNSKSPQSLTNNGGVDTVTLSHLVPKSDVEEEPLRIFSIRIEHADKEPILEEDGVPQILAGTDAVIRIFGTGLTEDTLITFTHRSHRYGGSCLYPSGDDFTLIKGSVVKHGEKLSSAKLKISLPFSDESFYICAKKPQPSREFSDITFSHQGTEQWLQIRTFDKLLPLWASLIIICVCLMFSALFSGLNLGLMSLDRTELKILCNTGTDKEKEYARIIQPVRDHGNFLLCSILLGNVAVNSTFTILLDDLTSGVVAVVCSTITIVLLGEITPQAICSRYGLAVGAKTIHVTKAVMVITFPVSYPVSKLLDFLLGEEIGNVYNRERLKELVRVTNDINDLDKDEVNIISGALEMRKKTVLEVMTKIEDVFMLDYEAVLDFETVSEIMKSGFSRIPVYENQRSNIVAMLYVKDLAFVDPDDNTPLKTLCQFYQNPCNFVFEDVTLDVIFKQFKEGHKGHLAFVQRVNSEGEGDPFYETIGLVTLEDVIEELIQAEIMDETDVFTDNKSKRRRNRPLNKLVDFGVFAERRENQRIRVSPQLTLATFQYLSTSVEAFKSDNVSETILRRLLKQDIIHHIKFRNKERLKLDPTTLIYEQGKPVDYFVLILEGRVEVTVGKENLMFESGPFTYFGSQALIQNVVVAESPVVPPSALGSLQSINMDSMLRHTFIPDYSVRAVTEVFYISIKRSLYLAAKRATLMEKCSGSRHKGSEDAGEQFDDEVEKLLHSLEEEGSPVTMTRSPTHHATPRHASPLGPNGSIRTSRQSSPAKQAPVAQQEPEFIDTTPTVPQETSTLLPHS